MDIRKISIGPDYKSGAMHYIVGQPVLGGNYTIHLIKQDFERESIVIYIEDEEGIRLWKEFTDTMPVSIEYNIKLYSDAVSGLSAVCHANKKSSAVTGSPSLHLASLRNQKVAPVELISHFSATPGIIFPRRS